MLSIPGNRDELLGDIYEQFAHSGEWEAIDTWGNGQIVMSDAESVEAAEALVDMIAQIWDTAYKAGAQGGRRYPSNPYREA